ncbi:MAG: 4Fe-4S binding protein [Lachnospiraceae bacterium]|nr:4Fe-4S binding protein [Lachnospiraceae bacterium]
MDTSNSTEAKFVEHFHIPEVARPYLHIFFTQKDLWLGAAVTEQSFTADFIQKITQEQEIDSYIQTLYHRGVISIVDPEKRLYRLNDFYGYLDIFCVSRKEEYQGKIPKEGRRAIDAWYFKAYCEGLDQDYKKPPTKDRILSLEEALAKVDEDDRPIYRTHCDCKCLLGDCGLPTDVCLSYKSGLNSYSDRGISRRIDKEEAKEVLRFANKAGLMQTWNPDGFCNCCGDCCYLFRVQKVRDSKRIWPVQSYLIQFDQEKCVGCGSCVKRCHFSVFTKNTAGKIEVDTSQCVGCGICAEGCKKGALELKALVQGNEREE